MKKLLFLLIVFTGLTFNAISQEDIPIVKNGKIDLTDWDFETDGKINLKGDWEFYWNQLLTYSDFHPKNRKAVPTAAYLKVPGTWNGKEIFSSEKPLPGLGYATYRIQVILPKETRRFTFKSLTAGTSSAIFVNEKEVAHSGKPGTTDAQTIPGFKPQVFDVYVDTHVVDIIVQTANFDYAKGGFWKPLSIGPEEVLRKNHERELFFSYFLIGGFFIIGLYHFGIFLIRRSDRANLYYAIGSILTGVRVASTGEYIIGYLSFIEWHMIIRLEILTFFMAVGVLGLFLNAIFPREMNRKILMAIVAVSGLFSLATLILSPLYFSYLVNPYQIFTVGAILYFIVVLIKAIRKKRSGSWLFTFGIIALSSFIVHDILVSVNIISGLQLAGLGFFIFMLIQSYILAVNFNQTFLMNARLKEKLAAANATLEQKVEQRTVELQSANEVKDKFFSIISHDLRGPVNSTKNALDFIIEDIDETEKDEIKADLNVVSRSLYVAHALLEDLLTWSRSQQGQIQLEPALHSADSLLVNPIEILQEAANKKNITIQLDVKKEHKAYVDLRTMKTVFRNLISNAIKFTEENGEILISSNVTPSQTTIIIKDSGVGIEEDKISTLFEISKNRSTTGTAGEVGTGLGLILTREFIEKNNGSISVTSELGKGTTFYINLPKEG